MREIKFRAWDIENKKWLKDWSSYKAGGSEQYFVGFNGDLGCHRTIVGLPMPMFDIDDEPDGIILEQYTGLKDKNGKEIYEGDIVDDGYSRICKIKWSEHFTAFEAINENDGYVSNIWFVAEYGKVIGNIHENPELLNRKEKE